MNVYTLILYSESDGSRRDWCGDWIPGPSSKLEIEYFTDPRECGVCWAVSNLEYSDIVLLVNGINCHGGYCTDEDYITEEIQQLWDEVYEFYSEKSAELLVERNRKIEEAKKQREFDNAEQERKRLEEIENQEREQYEYLRRKFA